MTPPLSGRRTSRRVRQGIATLLLAIPTAALTLNGATSLWVIALVQVALIALVSLFRGASEQTLQESGAGLSYFKALCPLLGAALVGLIVLPPEALRLLTSTGAPLDHWSTLSLHPSNTIAQSLILFTAISYGSVVTIWAQRRKRTQLIQWSVAIGFSLVAITALSHALMGSTRIFGLIPVQSSPPIFFAPFVNPNFLGTLMLFSVPVTLGFSVDLKKEHPRSSTLLLLLLCPQLIALVAIGSPGVFLAFILEGLLWLWALSPLKRSRKTLLTCAVFGLLTLWTGLFASLGAYWYDRSFAPRVSQWGHVGQMLQQRWFSGAGLGNFTTAYQPFPESGALLHFTHLHSDPLEWLIETGVIGLLSLTLSGRLLPWPDRSPRVDRWTLGLAGAALSSCVNFPFHIPAILILFAGLLAIQVARQPQPAVSPSEGRRLLAQLRVALLFALGLTSYLSLSERLVSQLESPSSSEAQVDTAARQLQLIAPYEPSLHLYYLKTAYELGLIEEGNQLALIESDAHPSDANLLFIAGQRLAQNGAQTQGETLLLRSIAQNPNDYRPWYALYTIYQGRTDGAKAIIHFTQALSHWPAHSSAGERPLEIGWNLVPIGEYWIDELAQAEGFWSEKLTRILLKNDQPELALQAMTQAARLKREHFVLHDTWIDVYLALGQRERAEKTALYLCEQAPDQFWPWYKLGVFYQNTDQLDRARDAFLKGFQKTGYHPNLGIEAILTTERISGPVKALQLADLLAIQLRSVPLFRLTQAKLIMRTKNWAQCLIFIDENNLLHPKETAQPAAELRQQCEHNLKRR